MYLALESSDLTCEAPILVDLKESEEIGLMVWKCHLSRTATRSPMNFNAESRFVHLNALPQHRQLLGLGVAST